MRRLLAVLVVLLAAGATVSSAVAAPIASTHPSDDVRITGQAWAVSGPADAVGPHSGDAVGLHPDDAVGPLSAADSDSAGAGSGPVATGSSAAGVGQQEPPPDPDSDVKGWEGGYWYNESLSVTNEDGLNRSELRKVVSRSMARVEYLRDVEFEQSVPVEVVTRAEYTRQYGSSNNTSAALRTFDNAKMEALLLIGEGNDSISVQNENRNTSVLGFYTPRDDQIVVISNGDTPQMEELTLGHELVHAYQDQAFNLSQFDSRTRDALNGRNGVVEGDANYVEHLYSLRCDVQWDCVSRTGGSGGGGNLANIGVYLMKFQPYSDGPKFVKTIRDEGGWEAVDALYEDVPASSEQVIHPEKYGEDQPTPVNLQDANTDSWERVRPPDRPDYGTVGEAGLVTTFVYPLYHGGAQIVSPTDWLNQTQTGVSPFDPLNYDTPYTEGWDGDRLHVYQDADGELAYVWRIVWDSPEDATEFYDGYQQVLSYWGAEEVGEDTYEIPSGDFADAFHVDVSGDTVTITNAPTVEELSSVRTDVTVVTPTPTDTPSPTPTVTPTGEEPTTDEGSPTDGSAGVIPGVGMTGALVALVATALLVGRRRR